MIPEKSKAESSWRASFIILRRIFSRAASPEQPFSRETAFRGMALMREPNAANARSTDFCTSGAGISSPRAFAFSIATLSACSRVNRARSEATSEDTSPSRPMERSRR